MGHAHVGEREFDLGKYSGRPRNLRAKRDDNLQTNSPVSSLKYASTPAILWCVLMVGGLLTLLSVNIFNSVNPKLHVFQVFSFTLLITLVLLAIADVNRPFKRLGPRQ